jgi:hypothetical protein
MASRSPPAAQLEIEDGAEASEIAASVQVPAGGGLDGVAVFASHRQLRAGRLRGRGGHVRLC